MAGSTLPPRAYTKEILAQAFEWLKKQPASIRELANSADNLVGLYETDLRRTRSGVFTDNSQASPSTQAFKADLKNLALDLKQFEEGSRSHAPTVETTAVKISPKDSFLNQFSQQLASSSKQQLPSPPNSAPNHSSQGPKTSIPPVNASPSVPSSPESESPAPTLSQADHRNLGDFLDRRTRELLTDVKESLNLSSEGEALRMLVKLGHDRLRDILPRL